MPSYLVGLEHPAIILHAVNDSWRTNEEFIPLSTPAHTQRGGSQMMQRSILPNRSHADTENSGGINLCASFSLVSPQRLPHMFSMRMVMCSVPRPLTRNVSAVSPSSTFIARLRSNSRNSRSRRLRDVTNLPWCTQAALATRDMGQ